MKYGIDVSEHNGNIDFTKYKPDFVIIRAGYGIRHTDKKFMRNVKECQRLGIPYGVYWFSEALTPEQAKEEADYFLDLVYSVRIDCGVWFDMEDSTWKNQHNFKKTEKNISDICETWCSIVEDAGYYTGIYCSQSWLCYLSSRCDRFDKWVAWWGHAKNTQQLGSMMQYTDKLGGADLDGNVCYVDLSVYQIGQAPVSLSKYEALVNELVNRVMSGEFGEGEERKANLGAIYEDVQKQINLLYGGGK